jgi:hypothetical protein
MTIIQFPTDPEESPFFKDIVEDGYHIYSLKNAQIPDFYPNEFPDYSGVKRSELQVGDEITVRVFFRVGSSDEELHVDGGYIDLEIEHIDREQVMGVIITQLPDGFALATGSSLEIFEEEILYKRDIPDQ